MASNREEILIALGIDATQLKPQSRIAGLVIEESLQDTFRAVKRMIGLNLVALAGDVMENWGKLTKWMAEQWYGLDMQVAQGKALDKNRSFWKKMREEFEMQDKIDKAADTALKKYEKENSLLQEQIDAVRTLNDLAEKGWKDDSTKVIETKQKILDIAAKRIQHEMSASRLAGDQLEYDKQQIEFEKNRSAQIQLKSQVKQQEESSSEANRIFRKERTIKEAAMRPVIESQITPQMQEAERTRNIFNAQRKLQGLPLIPGNLPNVSDIASQIKPDATPAEVKDLNSTIVKLWKEGLQIKASE